MVYPRPGFCFSLALISVTDRAIEWNEAAAAVIWWHYIKPKIKSEETFRFGYIVRVRFWSLVVLSFHFDGVENTEREKGTALHEDSYITIHEKGGRPRSHFAREMGHNALNKKFRCRRAQLCAEEQPLSTAVLFWFEIFRNSQSCRQEGQLRWETQISCQLLDIDSGKKHYQLLVNTLVRRSHNIATTFSRTFL